MQVVALTTGRNDPSARFRIRQHILPLANRGIHVSEFFPLIDKHAGLPSKAAAICPPAALGAAEAAWRLAKLLCRVPGVIRSRGADLIWLNRELVLGRHTLERFLTRPFVLDVDDAVWQAQPDGHNAMKRLARESAAVIAGNAHIARWFEPHARQVFVIPTAIDTRRFRPVDASTRADQPMTVGWTGSAGNFKFLYAIETPLAEFLEQADARILVIAESRPAFRRIPNSRVLFEPWSQATEAASVAKMDIGLMPLPDTDWTRGKCSFKMLQYMSTGIPVVVSPVGMNSEVLAMGTLGFGASSDEEWLESLCALAARPELRAEMGREGRRVACEHFDVEVVASMLARAFSMMYQGR